MSVNGTDPVGVFVGGSGAGGGGQWLQMTGALRIKLPKFGEVTKRSSRLNVHLMFPLFPANHI